MLTAVVPDLHIPDHDEGAVEWALNLISDLRPDEVVFLGDMFDFMSISRFLKHPKQSRLFSDEVKTGKAFVKMLASRLPKKAKVQIIGGNHEDRLAKYLFRHAPELADEPSLTVPALMEFPKKWVYYDPSVPNFQTQGVIVMHGRRFAGNVALANMRRYVCSVVQGHSHRVSTQYLRVADGRLLSSAECGCLCQLSPRYAGVTDWTHALGWIDDGLVTVQVKA